MKKNLFFVMILGLGVVASSSSLRAMAPARPLTASEQAGQLKVLVIKNQRVPVASIQSFFNALRSENQAGQFPVLKADAFIATTVADLRKLQNGELVANSLDRNYRDVIRRQLRA